MAKFVKSNRSNVVSSNVVSDTAPVANAGLGSMPTNLGSMPANLGATPIAPVANVETRSRFGRTAKPAQSPTQSPAKPVQSPAQPVQSPVQPVQSPVQPALSMSDIMEAMNILINQEVAKVYEKIHCMAKEIEAANAKLNKISEEGATFSEGATMQLKDIETRVKDIEDYLSGEGEECESSESPTVADGNSTNLTFVPDQLDESQVSENADEDESQVSEDGDESGDEDELTPEDIDPEKVLAFLRKEPNVSVNVIRSVRAALGRKQFAISSIKNDYDAFVECLEALDSMEIDLEQFVK